MKDEFLNFPENISGFSRVEYLSVFVALLYAFSVAEFFIGWSRMLRNRDNITISIDHILFTIVYFWTLIIGWYSLWPRIALLDNGFIYFVITLLPILLVYLAVVFIFPDFDKVKDLNVYFDKNFNVVMYITTAFLVVHIIIGLCAGEVSITSVIVITRITNCILMLIVAMFNLKKLRRALLLFLIAGLTIGSIQLAFV